MLRRLGRLSFQTSLMLWFLLVVAISLAVLSYAGIRTLQDDMMDDIMRLARDKVVGDLNVHARIFYSKGSRVEIKDGQMVIDGTYVVNDNPEIVDAVKYLAGGTATIFQGDTRIATNVLTSDGQRAVGTQVAANVAETVLKRGEKYVGRAWVVNAWYMTAYEPILDPSGKIIGMLYVGTPEKPFTDAIDGFIARTIYISLGALVLAGIVSFFVARRITRPIRQLTAVAQTVAAGDLTREVTISSQDEVGVLAASFNRMTANLRTLIEKEVHSREQLQQQVGVLLQGVGAAAQGDLTRSVSLSGDGEIGKLSQSFNLMIASLHGLASGIQQTATDLSSRAQDMTSFAVDQASGAAEQAAAVGEVTAAMDELSRTAQQITHNAEATLAAAEQGHLAVDEATRGMEQIKATVDVVGQRILALGDKTQRIGDIVELINEVAGTTHLLALNAAIEAASAGEFGRRFAVVAGQVKELSNATRESTKQVKALIEEIQSAANASVLAAEQATKVVERGVDLSHHAETAIREMTDMAQAITQATQQQEMASEQVVQTMHDVAEVARRAAVGSQSTTDSARTLTATVEQLRAMVSTFNT